MPPDKRKFGIWSAPSSEGESYRRALDAIAYMRKGHSLSSAASLAHTTPYNIRAHAGEALIRDAATNWTATESDNLVRPMRAVTTEGLVDLNVFGSRRATLVAEHANAVKHFLATGETEELRTFRGRVVAGKRLETDPDKLEDFANQGELEFEDLYQS